MNKVRTYSELISFNTFPERFQYLVLNGSIADETFGYDRYLNQIFYHSPEWKKVRRKVIIRDSGCDLGVEGYEIEHGLYIHHLNPITAENLITRDEFVIDPEFLICCSLRTHNAIHYGSVCPIYEPIERKKNDTCLWR